MNVTKLISRVTLLGLICLTTSLVSCKGDDDVLDPNATPLAGLVGDSDYSNKVEVGNLTVIERNERVILKWTAPANVDENLFFPKIYFGEGTTAAEATTEISIYEVYGDTLTVIAELSNNKSYVFVVKTQDMSKLFDGNNGESAGVSVVGTPVAMNEVFNPDLIFGSFTDTSRDGQVYKTIQIGTQVWMAENYRYLPSVYLSTGGTGGTGSYTEARYYVSGYEGTDVAAAKTNTITINGVDWNGDGLEYEGGSNSKTVNCYETFGVLYNQVAAESAPPGWHLPTDEEWKTLEKYLGMSATDANIDNDYRGEIAPKLAAQLAWPESPLSTGMPAGIGYNFYSHNSSGFSALPGGTRMGQTGGFYDLGLGAVWWSSTPSTTTTTTWSYTRELYNAKASVYRGTEDNQSGCSVRYIKD